MGHDGNSVHWTSRPVSIVASGILLCAAALYVWGDVFAAAPGVVLDLRVTLQGGASTVLLRRRPELVRVEAEQRYLAAKKAALALVQTSAAVPRALQPISRCDSFSCLRRERKGLATRFNFPHFYLVGFSKCATTSIASYYKRHPQILFPVVRYSPWYKRSRNGGKEAHFFDNENGCGLAEADRCKSDMERFYLRNVLRLEDAARANFSVAAFEATPKYAKEAYSDDRSLASFLGREMPWLKIAISIREPISHAISYCLHLGHVETDTGMVHCLDYRFGLSSDGERFDRLQPMLKNFTLPVSRWLAAFPPAQLHVLQYEKVIDDRGGPLALHGLTSFLGLEQVEKPLAEKNVRKTAAKCWPMSRRRYDAYFAAARADGVSLSALLDESGLADGGDWLAAWEAVWERQHAMCGPTDCCLVPS